MKDEDFDSMKIPKRIVAKIRQFTSVQEQKPKGQGMRPHGSEEKR